MKIFIFVAIFLFSISASLFFSCKEIKPVAEKAIAQTLLTQVDSFASLAKNLQVEVATGSANKVQLQQLFLQTRFAYKKIEWATEYFAPQTSRFVNGPPVAEIETTGNLVLEQAGLQVIEGFFYPEYNVLKKNELIAQLKMLQVACNQYKTYFTNIDLLDWQVFDAAKLEVFRIQTLGITGFDNPFMQACMSESEASLESLKKVLSYYTSKANAKNLLDTFDATTKYLSQHSDFNSFDRAAFITEYANPLTIGFSNLQKKLNFKVIQYNRLLRQDAMTLFEKNAFNVDAYAPDQSAFISREKIALGKLLFADPVLSGNGKRSCQSCHQPDKAFADGLVKNTGINSRKPLKRNTPSLLNAALQPSQFYDLRVNTLEDQSLNVVQNTEEMHGSMKVSVNKLWQNVRDRKQFSIAYPKPKRTGIDSFEVVNALSSYVRSLVFLNSRFDEYMRGNKTAMSKEEVNGFNLFMGKAKCATCHYMPLFNGTRPPRFIKMETEVIGVPKSINSNISDNDMGRFDVLNIALLKRSFKTPTVRNAARTAPYMHNGVFAKLGQVVDFYNKGGGAGLDLPRENQTLPFDKLNLSAKERNEIIAFIKSLDSK